MKIIFSSTIVIIIVGGLLYLHLRGNRLTKEFYEMEIRSLVIKRSDWQKRSIDFYLDNGIILNLLAPADGKLEIGDSVQKAKNSFKYDVYRKNIENKYKLFATYDYNKHEY